MSPDVTKPRDPTAGLEDLAPIRAKDADTFVAAGDLAGARSRRHYFPALYFEKGKRRRLLWEKHGESVIVYKIGLQPDKSRLALWVPPFPFEVAALRHAIERMQEYNQGKSGQIMSLTAEEALIVARHNFAISFKEEEYILDRAAVVALEGSNFKKLRQELSRAMRAGDLVETRPYRAEDQPACIALVESWKKRLTDAGVKIGGDSVTRACLARADRFQYPLLSGLVVEIDGVVRGFNFSGRISDKMGCSFLGITDTRFRGLPHLLRNRLMELYPDIPYFNGSTDAGREGLRDLKQRFRPVQMQDLYSAYLR